MACNYCCLSFNLILYFSTCALSSCNFIFLLYVNISSVHPVSSMLFGGMCTVVVGVTCACGGMKFVGAEKACCAISSSEGAFCCEVAPDGIVACAGYESVCSFA